LVSSRPPSMVQLFIQVIKLRSATLAPSPLPLSLSNHISIYFLFFAYTKLFCWLATFLGLLQQRNSLFPRWRHDKSLRRHSDNNGADCYTVWTGYHGNINPTQKCSISFWRPQLTLLQWVLFNEWHHKLCLLWTSKVSVANFIKSHTVFRLSPWNRHLNACTDLVILFTLPNRYSFYISMPLVYNWILSTPTYVSS
jgi:hypothetical protein